MKKHKKLEISQLYSKLCYSFEEQVSEAVEKEIGRYLGKHLYSLGLGHLEQELGYELRRMQCEET